MATHRAVAAVTATALVLSMKVIALPQQWREISDPGIHIGEEALFYSRNFTNTWW